MGSKLTSIEDSDGLEGANVVIAESSNKNQKQVQKLNRDKLQGCFDEIGSQLS